MSTPEQSEHYKKTLPEDQPIIKIMGKSTPQEFMGFLHGNYLKYSYRIGNKAGTNDAVKAQVYKDWYQEFIAFRHITLLGKQYSYNFAVQRHGGSNEPE